MAGVGEGSSSSNSTSSSVGGSGEGGGTGDPGGDGGDPAALSPVVRVCLGSTLGAVLAAAVLGNLMVLGVIVQNRGMRTRTNLLLCNLAAAHLLTAVLDMPLAMVTVLQGGGGGGAGGGGATDEWTLGRPACMLSGFLSILFFVTSIHTLMYISVHKCVSIRQPYCQVLSHSRVMLMIGGTWVWASLSAALSIAGLNTVQYQPYEPVCSVVFPPNTLRTYIHSAFTAATTYLIPFIVMCTCYLIMFIEIRSHWRGAVVGGTVTQKDVIYSQQQRISTTLFVVLLSFLLLWAPYAVLRLYNAMLAHGNALPPIAFPVTYWIGYLSCAINPIIYAIRSPAFRNGYKHIFCKDPDSGLSSGANDDYESAYSKPMRKFRALLRETLQGGGLTGSGSLTGSVTAGAGSGPPSRKSSMTSLTNFLLLPKMRSLSTNSLPGNFRFSLNQRLLAESDTTKVSIIAGIPVLTKGGKIVCYQNPHETPRRKLQSPVYYPPLTTTPAGRGHHSKASERSSLLQPVLQNDDVFPASSAQPVPAHMSHHCPQDVYLRSPASYVATETAPLGLKPRLGQRPSSESGFNDDDDDAVFIVVAADIEAHPVNGNGAASLAAAAAAAAVLGGGGGGGGSGEGEHRRHVLEEHSESLQGLLDVDLGGPPQKQRVCKSVSDAPHMPSLGAYSRTFPKSTSDTCIQEAQGGEGLTEEDEGDDETKKTKSSRPSILTKIFARNKEKRFSSSAMGSPQSRKEDSGGGTYRHGARDSDASDSGLVSGILDSPKLSHTLPRNKSKRSGSVVYQSVRREDHRSSAPTLDPNVLHKSSSDPCLDEAKSKKRSKSKLRHRKSAGKNSKRHHANDAKDEMGGEAFTINSELHKELGRAGKGGKMKPFPSVEKLDFDMRRDSSNSEGYRSKRHKSRDKAGALRLYSDNDVLDFDLHCKHYHRNSGGDAGEHKSLSSSPSPRAPSLLFRSFSDPNLTFKRIEERVVQRTLTRKWTKTQKTRKKKRSRHRLSVTGEMLDPDNVSSTRSLDSMETNEPGSSNGHQAAAPAPSVSSTGGAGGSDMDILSGSSSITPASYCTQSGLEDLGGEDTPLSPPPPPHEAPPATDTPPSCPVKVVISDYDEDTDPTTTAAGGEFQTEKNTASPTTTS